MSDHTLPVIHLVRHGETEWSRTGRHTGRTDLPLTPRGEENARRLGDRLRALTVARVFTSPLIRAKRTAELAGFPDAEVDADLTEWHYGLYEGRTTAEIVAARPGWNVFLDGGGPGGETTADVLARVDRVIARVREVNADVLLFSSGHLLRVLAARWVGLDATAGRLFALSTGAVSQLGYDHDLNEPVIRLWNDAGP